MRTFLTSILVFIFFSAHAQHQWIRTNPGGGGAIAVVKATAPDANGKSTILVASDLSGIYRSTDNGASFDVVGASQGLLETHVSALGLDPNNPLKFFAGTYSYLYKTEDGGNSFTKVFPTAPNAYCYAEDIAISKSNSSIGYVTYHPGPETDGKVYKTTDGGTTWGAVPNEDLPTGLHLVKLMVHPLNADVVYALSGKSRWGCGKAELYRSKNGGIHWTKIGNTKGEILDFDVLPTAENTVYISTFKSNYADNASCRALGLDAYIYAPDPTPAGEPEPSTRGETYVSTNEGVSFTKIGDVSGILSVESAQKIRLVNMVFPVDWNDDAGIWQTTNAGTTWTMVSDITTWKKGHSKNQYFAFGHSFNGLNKSVTRDIFNPDRFFGSFGQWAWASLTAGASLDNISTKEIGTDTWQSTGMENIIGTSLDVNETDPNYVYMGGYDIGFWFSTDGGTSWRRRQPDFKINPYHLYTWNVGDVPADVDPVLAKTGAGGNVMTILNDPKRKKVVWASFSKGQYYSTNGVDDGLARTGLFRSGDNGENWTLVDNGLPAFNSSFMMYGLSLDVKSGNPDFTNRTLYVTVNSNVYKSTNDGVSWTAMPMPAGMKVKYTEVDKFNGTVYAGGKSGLWRLTTAPNDVWTKVSTLKMESTKTNTYPDIVPTYIGYDDNGSITELPWEGIFDIQTDPNNENHVYATVHAPNGDTQGGIEGGLYFSNNAGASWTKLYGNDKYVRGVAIAPANSDILYLTASESYNSGAFGNSSGIHFSKDGGATWETANDGMAFHFGGLIEIETGDNPHVWAWSQGTGMQKALIPFTVLPVEYLSPFTASLQQGGVRLNWETAEENDADYFLIERSANGQDWAELSVVGAKNRPSTYARIDANPITPITYYRLKQVDLDGRYTYSPVVSVRFEGVKQVNIFPNPTKGNIVIDAENQILSVELIDLLGRTIKNINRPNSNAIDLEDVENGIYNLKVTTVNGTSVHALNVKK